MREGRGILLVLRDPSWRESAVAAYCEAHAEDAEKRRSYPPSERDQTLGGLSRKRLRPVKNSQPQFREHFTQY